MSINISIPGMNAGAFGAMNPVSDLTSMTGSALNSAQSGIMQTLSQLFGSLSQLFGMGGAQNGQFQANPFSQNLGNSLGQMPNMGNQAFNMGQPMQLGNNFGQAAQPLTGDFANGQSRSVGGCGGGQASPQTMSAGDAAQVLDRNFDRLSNGKETFNTGDLTRVANDPNSPPELRRAAQTVLDNPSMMNSLDNADARAEGRGQNLDGKFSRGDMAAAGSYVPQQPMTAERAAQTLNQDFNKFSGGKETVTADDLSRVANDPNQSQQMRSAAQFLLSNPSAFNNLDNAHARADGQSQSLDGRISKGDANAGSIQSNPSSQNFGQASQPAMSTGQAAQVLDRNFDTLSNGNKTFNANDLVRVANDPNSSPELRQAAQTVLSNPSMMNKLDNADARADGLGQNLDGKVSRGDLAAAGSYVQ